MQFHQRILELPAKKRGFHLITANILDKLPEIEQIKSGMLHLFLQHTSASLTINENADPSVRQDLEMAANHIVPEGLPYVHTAEGSDDMPAHVKSSLIGASLTIPVTGGQLALGTWQGLYLCEHRDHGSPRRIVMSLTGV